MSRRAHGFRAWLIQRITALYSGLFTLAVAALFLLKPPSSHQVWQDLVGNTAISVLTVIFFIAIFLHAWVGIRDLFMDYIKSVAVRLTLLMLLGGFLISCTVWLLRIMVKVVLQ